MWFVLATYIFDNSSSSSTTSAAKKIFDFFPSIVNYMFYLVFYSSSFSFLVGRLCMRDYRDQHYYHYYTTPSLNCHRATSYIYLHNYIKRKINAIRFWDIKKKKNQNKKKNVLLKNRRRVLSKKKILEDILKHSVVTEYRI